MQFISCDWGSSSFRLRLADRDQGTIGGELSTDRGATVLASSLPSGATPAARARFFADYLSGQIEALQARVAGSLHGLPVVVSGMATSAHGWRELPYAAVPFSIDGRNSVVGSVALQGQTTGEHSVTLLSGVRTARDVMRGEESEILGLFRHPTWRPLRDEAIVLLPGTHAKHVTIHDGAIVDFHTYMSGELYALLLQHSVLRHSLPAPGGRPPAVPSGAGSGSDFVEGVRAANQDGLGASLFRVRVHGLFRDKSPEANALFLSGLLIGDELKALAALPSRAPLVLCARRDMAWMYAAALTALGQADRLHTVPADEARLLSTLGHCVYLSCA